jgi:hypothetical protein
MTEQTGQQNSHHDFQPVRQAPETTLKLRALAPGRYQAISEPEYKKKGTDYTTTFNKIWSLLLQTSHYLTNFDCALNNSSTILHGRPC